MPTRGGCKFCFLFFVPLSFFKPLAPRHPGSCRYFFDIHPPLGKLTLYWLGNLLGYDAYHCDYWGDIVGAPYAPYCRYYILRAIAGTFVVGWPTPHVVFTCRHRTNLKVSSNVSRFASCIRLRTAASDVHDCSKDGHVQLHRVPVGLHGRIRLPECDRVPAHPSRFAAYVLLWTCAVHGPTVLGASQ